MKPFDNVTNAGNEKAIRRGHTVPDGDVNLAFIKAPELSPKNNVVVVDTSRIAEENVNNAGGRSRLYYANSVGILVDENNNMVVPDEFPAVSDVFSADEDFNIMPGSEYRNHHILPYKHTSRYFHLDHAGLTMGGDVVNYDNEAIKVIDGRGVEYSNYRIKIAAAYLPGNTVEGATWAYRVFAYVDTLDNTDLYLSYNKVELQSDGTTVRRQINYRERLNPKGYFEYQPEESEVVDPANRNKAIYSSKPLTFKDQILGKPTTNVDGFKIYVPKKAVGDPRIYQLFRWRIKTTFKQDVKTDPSRDLVVKCGVIVTNDDLKKTNPSRAPYAILNMSRSRYNAKGIVYQNPTKDNHSSAEQEKRDYWFVNIDKDDLSQYDLLLWAPNNLSFDFSPYSAKINTFTKTHGGTLFLDTNTYADAVTSLGGRVSLPFTHTYGKPRTSTAGSSAIPVRADLPGWGDATHPLLNGGAELGGWTFKPGSGGGVNRFNERFEADYDALTTRGAFAKALVDVLREIPGFVLPARKVGAFTDVTSKTPYRAEIEILAAMGVAQGGTTGRFNPTYTVNRAQAASLIDRTHTEIVAFSPLLNPLPLVANPFTAEFNNSYVHASAIRRLYGAKIFLGYADGTFRPNENLTNRHMAMVFTRWFTLLGNAGVSTIILNDDLYSLSYTQHRQPGFCQNFSTAPSGYTTLVKAKLHNTTNTYRSVIVAAKAGSGNKVLSTFATLQTCSAIYDTLDPTRVSFSNMGSTLQKVQKYLDNISGLPVEGAMKFLYNVSLLAVRGRLVDDSDETSFSTTWTYSTPWKSSWVINASNEVLSLREKAEHNFLIDARDIHANDTTPVWKRRLANQTIRQIVDENLRPILENPSTAARVADAVRSYEIEVTNPYVQTASKVVENGYPHAWTEAYTPKFSVPVELGAHIVKEEVDAAGRKGRVAKYEDATYDHISYPDRPYSAKVNATYVDTEDLTTSAATTYTATGTAVATIKITTTSPPVTTTNTSDVALSWFDSQVATRPVATRGNYLNPGTAFELKTSYPHYGVIKPVGIRTWQNANYYSSSWGPGNLCWPYWGMTSRLEVGSSGILVKFVQDAMNRFSANRFFSAGKLTVNGDYGPTTKGVVQAFQTKMQARYIDGVVDAETWSLIAMQIHRLDIAGKLPTHNPDNHLKYYRKYKRILEHRLSDSNANTYIARRSWRSGGPSVVWDMYAVTFKDSHKWHGLTVIPYTAGDYDRIMVRSIHVTNTASSGYDLKNYDSKRGQLTYMPHRPKDGSKLYIPFGPYTGNTIILGVGQDHSSGFGSSRIFGIRDILGHTRVTTSSTTTNQNISYQQKDITFTVTGSVEATSYGDKTVQLQVPELSQYHSISGAQFTSISVSNPKVTASVTANGLATFRVTAMGDIPAGEAQTSGSDLPGGPTYYSMDETGRFNPVPETGWVSKTDGIKLLCDANRKPVGFPLMPTGVGKNEAQRHYASLTISTDGTDSSVQLGFYDKSRQEFVTSADGRAEISYIEYINRGPHNIYVAVISSYEDSERRVIPVDDDAPRLPYRWAMPVYGVTTQAGSRITLEPLPEKLGARDVWPIAVREGRFMRTVKVRKRGEGPLTGYLKEYQGATVHAFYGLPEAELGGYSSIYGPPNTDVVDEQPIILDDDVIQVRQAPILQVQMPTAYPNITDPVRPVLKFSKRATRTGPWVAQGWEKIRDYNLRTGEIWLTDKLTSNDSTLLRVDYTTSRRQYHFKKFEAQYLNLNAYSGHSRDLLGEAIYVYIVPQYVKDERGNIITGSHNERTLRMSLSPSVFDPIRPEYDPLAIQLGVVYMSTALNIDELAILDTRRRGGGVSSEANMREVARLVNDASTYWDAGYAAGGSYQKAGYVVIRLPEALKQSFSEEEITDIIKMNITAGVGFKLEDLQGRNWS